MHTKLCFVALCRTKPVPSSHRSAIDSLRRICVCGGDEIAFSLAQPYAKEEADDSVAAHLHDPLDVDSEAARSSGSVSGTQLQAADPRYSTRIQRIRQAMHCPAIAVSNYGLSLIDGLRLGCDGVGEVRHHRDKGDQRMVERKTAIA